MEDKILAGLHDALAHAAGERSAAKEVRVQVPEVDVKSVRKRLGLSQTEFAVRFGFKLATVRGWEQGRRRPDPSARVLMRIIEREPDAVLRALDLCTAA